MGESRHTELSILGKIQDVVRDVVEDDSIVLHMETTARDVAGWDSLANIRIILSTERAFGLKISTTEIMGLRNVGDFVRTIAHKTAKSA